MFCSLFRKCNEKTNIIYCEQDTYLEIGCKSTTIPKDMKIYLNKQIEIRDNNIKPSITVD